MSAGSGTVLTVNNVSKTFHAAGGHPVPVLDRLTFEIKTNEAVAFIGPSGCGKTTQLKLIAGLMNPTSGEVRVDGELPAQACMRGWLSMLFQTPVLLPWMTVQRNVELPGRIARSTEAVKRAAERIKQVGLDGFQQAYPNQLSGGMRARVALARALTVEPKILLMDEPFASLDALTRQHMHTELFRVLELEPAAIVLVTHDIEEAVLLSDRVFVLSERPAHIRDVVNVELPAPTKRDRRIREHPDFLKARRRIEELTLGM